MTSWQITVLTAHTWPCLTVPRVCRWQFLTQCQPMQPYSGATVMMLDACSVCHTSLVLQVPPLPCLLRSRLSPSALCHSTLVAPTLSASSSSASMNDMRWGQCSVSFPQCMIWNHICLEGKPLCQSCNPACTVEFFVFLKWDGCGCGCFRSCDFLSKAFSLFPDFDFCIMTVPHLVPEFPLIQSFLVSVCVCVCMCVCMCVHVCVYTVRVCVCACTCTHSCTHVCEWGNE